MAARKLALEIDRTLKRVAEGVELFESIYEKMAATTHLPQKEKLENDLKTQIKKLQRMRDQIKTWLASNEIKDKTALADARKLIEQQMEKFKACEKEMKTKAFSKEGLSAATKLDPKEQLKQEMSAWTGNMVEELGRQVEVTEAEIEALAGNVKKKGSKSGAVTRVVELETLNERRKWHIGRLELILRLMENGNLEPDSITTIKEDVAYFVESNQEEDFEEDEGIYDDLNLQEEEGLFDMANDDLQSSHDSHSVADPTDVVSPSPQKPPARSMSGTKPSREASTDDTPEIRSPPPKAVSSSIPTKGRKATLEGGSVRPNLSGPAPPVPKTSHISSVVPASAPTPRATPVIMPPIRYSAMAAAAVAPPTTPAPSTPAAVIPSTPVSTQPLATIPGPIPSASIAQGVKTTPAGSTIPVVPSAAPMPSPGDISLVGSKESSTPSRTSSPALSVASSQPPQLAPSPAPSLPQTSPLQTPEISAAQVASAPLPPSSTSSHAQQAQQQQAQQAAAEQARLPNSLTDLVTSFESAKSKAQTGERDLASITQILESGYSNVPQASDAEKPKYYVPKQPYPTPHYYPQQPTAVLDQPAMFGRFDTDTLFYIFYYQVGTYQQYLAAEELKKRAWRFHKQYLTWFQRANEPQIITPEYEQGVYLYFDWETAFASRKKNSFKFSYNFLESD